MAFGRHSYVPFYPSDWLAGTARMTRLHRSIYFDVCCYIWDKAAPCPEAELPLMLGDLPNWRDLVEDLILAGKLSRTPDRSLVNDRALSVARDALDLWTRKSEGGRKRQASRSDGSTPTKSDENTPVNSPGRTGGGDLPQNQNQNQNQEESPQPPETPIDAADPDGEDDDSGAPPLPPATPREDDAVDEAFRLYNETAHTARLTKAQVLTERREKQLRRRLAECGGIEGWRVAMAKLAASPLCTGDNDRGWRADIDFVLQPKSFTRLMEGFYDARAPVGRGSGGGKVEVINDLIDRAREFDQRHAASGDPDDLPEIPW